MRPPVTLLVVGEDARVERVEASLRRRGHTIAALGESGLPPLERLGLGVVVVDVPPLAVARTLERVNAVRGARREAPVFLLTSHGSEALAVGGFRAGITDYFNEQTSVDEIVAALERCLVEASPPVTHRLPQPSSTERMIGQSPALRAVRTYIARVAPSDCNVLIAGETGTGKELVVELIHADSVRARKPLVAINCAAIPDGLLESELFGYERGAFTGAGSRHEGRLRAAHGGTAFLDEIGDMSLDGQAKLLRVIETKQIQRLGGEGNIAVDVRIVAATNQDLDRLVAEGKFRADLYYRLAVARIRLPPLRERPQDITLLIAHYLSELNRRLGRDVEGFTEEAVKHLLHHTWPGNVRELKNTLEAIYLQGPRRIIDCGDLPSWFPRTRAHGDAPCGEEREALLHALEATNWNKSKAAQRMHVSRMTLYRKLVKYRLTSEERTEAT